MAVGSHSFDDLGADSLVMAQFCARARKRAYLHQCGIKIRIARRGVESSTKLGRHRWVIERTTSWLLRFKRLGLRYDRTERTRASPLTLAMVLINLRRLAENEF